jgi:CBS domain containing-hemolysin-like protein
MFLSADAALGSLSSARISALLEQEDLPHKATLQRYQTAPWGMQATYVVGRVLFAAVTAVLAVQIVSLWLAGVAGTVLGVVLAVAIYAPISDVAMAVARRRAETWGLRMAAALRPFELLFWPLSAPLARLSVAVARRVEEPQAHDPIVASAEVEYMVDEVERSGAVGSDPAEIIRNVLEFEDIRATDVMVPRARIEGIEIGTPLPVVRKLVAESGHSRYPIYAGQLDNIVGLLYAKDVFKLDPSVRIPETRLTDVVRGDVIFVAEQQKLVTLLKEMRQKRQHLAIVVDEFGGTAGLVTLEDVIEEIVGDIKDEHDEESAAPIEEMDDGRLLAIASVRVGDLAAYLACDIPIDLHESSVATALELGPVEVGATFERWGLLFTVSEIDAEKNAQRLEVVKQAAGSIAPPKLSSVPPSPPRAKDGPDDAHNEAAS